MAKSKMDQRRTRYANRPVDKPKAEPLWHFIDRASDFTEVLSCNDKRNHDWERQWYTDAEAKDSFTPRVVKPEGVERDEIKALNEHNRRTNRDRMVKDDYKYEFQGTRTIVHRGDFGPTGAARKIPNLSNEVVMVDGEETRTLKPGSYVDYGFDERAETEPSKARVYFARDAFEGTKNWYWTEKLISEPHKTNPAYGKGSVDYDNPDYTTSFSETVEPKDKTYSKVEKYDIGQAYIDNLGEGRKKEGNLRDEFAAHYKVASRIIQTYARFADDCNYFGRKQGKTGREFAMSYKGTTKRLSAAADLETDDQFDWVLVIKPENIWKAPWA